MAVIEAFTDGWVALRDNPVLLVVGLLVAVVGQLRRLGEIAELPVVSEYAAVGWFLLFPFVFGGFAGMALAAIRESETSLARFVRAGRLYYVRILLATILFVVLVVGVLLAAMPLSFMSAVLVVLGGLGEIAWLAALLLSVGTSLLALPAVVLLVFFLQFYDVAIVVENGGVRDAFSRSAGAVRHNLPSVLGFSILWGILANSFLSPEYLIQAPLADSDSALRMGIEPHLPSAIFVPLVVVLTAVAFTYLYTVYTAYFVRLRTPEIDDTTGPAEG